MFTLLSIIYFLCIANSQDVTCKEEMSKWDKDFRYNKYLDDNMRYKLHWTVGEDGIIDFGMSTCSATWIGIGFSPGTGMKNSHLIIGHIDRNNKPILTANYSLVNDRPLSSKTQSHITLKSGAKVNNVLKFRFTYDNNCKQGLSADDDRYKIPQASNRMIFASGELNSDGTLAYHGTESKSRSTRSVNILSGEEQKDIQLEPNTNSYEIRHGYDLTGIDTEYVCKLFKMPVVTEKKHIIQIAPVIEEKNKGIFHHVVLYACPSSAFETEEQKKFLDNSTSTLCDNYYYVNKVCKKTVFFIWAIGGSELNFPKEAGFPFGGDIDLKYVYMETHYDNPGKKLGISDKSGLKITYTGNLRPNDAGNIGFGTYSILAPEKSVVTNYGIHTSKCTQHLEQPINAFASLLHAHNAGSKISLRHIRNNKELKPIDVNEFFDFNYQTSTIFQKPIVINKNDTLIVSCTYDTRDRTEVTRYGKSSREEMCNCMIFYYPASKLMACSSEQTKTQKTNFFQTAKQKNYLTCKDSQNCNYNTFSNYDYSNPDAKKFYDDFFNIPINKDYIEFAAIATGNKFYNSKLSPFQKIDWNFQSCPKSNDKKDDDNDAVADSVSLLTSQMSIAALSIIIISTFSIL